MRKFKGSMLTTIGAVALTLGAATAALAVNAGILRSAPDSGVGNLETEATVPVTTADPNVRYVTVFVDEPGTTTVPVAPAAPVATTVAGDGAGIPGEYEDGYEGEYESEYEGEYEDHGSDHEEHEYEGADDDD